MQTLASILRELIGLFVDDGRFAVTLLLWIALAGLLDERWAPAGSGGVILFVGLAVILLESLLRFARKSGKETRHTRPVLPPS